MSQLYMASTGFRGPVVPANWQTDVVLNIWVRGTVGSDLNSGYERAKPLKTLAAAYDRIPYHVNAPVIIHVGAHAGNGYEIPNFRNKVLNAPVVVWGDGAGEAGNGRNVLRTEQVQAGTDQIHIVGPNVYPVDTYTGYFLTITDGPAAGDIRTLKELVNNEFWASELFSAIPLPGNTYEVWEPTVKLDPTATGYESFANWTDIRSILNQNNMSGLCFVNFKLHGAGPRIVANNSTVFFYGIMVTQGVCLHDGIMCAGVDWMGDSGMGSWYQRKSLIGKYLTGLNDQTWLGWGISGVQWLSNTLGYWIGYLVSLDPSAIYVNHGTNYKLLGGRCTQIASANMYGAVAEHSYGAIQGSSLGPADNYFIFSQTHPTNKVITISFADMHAYAAEFRNTGTGAGVYASVKGFVQIETCRTPVGVPLPGIGVQTNRGGDIRVYGALTVLGTAGDFSEDNGVTPRLAAALPNNTWFRDAVRGSTIWRSN